MISLSHLTARKSWLAPLAGYTDQGFRNLVKDWGADVLVSEMVSADGLVRDSKKTIQYLMFKERERPFGIQLFGSNARIMAQAVDFCLQYSPDFIDLNMGCPVKKVVKRGAGSALMQNSSLAASIVKETKAVCSGHVPLSVKFRSGWDNSSLNFLEFGLILQDAGADFVCLHARTQKQMFTGHSNWEHIRILKQSLDIPVIGNGDIVNQQTAAEMYRLTGCDSVMIGRGALGQPWIFSQITQIQSCHEPIQPDTHVIKQAIIKHLDYALEHKPEHVVVREMRAHICFYTKGWIGGAELRRQINTTGSVDKLKQLILNYS